MKKRQLIRVALLERFPFEIKTGGGASIESLLVQPYSTSLRIVVSVIEMFKDAVVAVVKTFSFYISLNILSN